MPGRQPLHDLELWSRMTATGGWGTNKPFRRAAQVCLNHARGAFSRGTEVLATGVEGSSGEPQPQLALLLHVLLLHSLLLPLTDSSVDREREEAALAVQLLVRVGSACHVLGKGHVTCPPALPTCWSSHPTWG